MSIALVASKPSFRMRDANLSENIKINTTKIISDKIEKLIMADVEKSYETAAAQTSQYIRDNSEKFS